MAKGHVFDPADFVIHIDGLCRLNLKWPESTIRGTGIDVNRT